MEGTVEVLRERIVDGDRLLSVLTDMLRAGDDEGALMAGLVLRSRLAHAEQLASRLGNQTAARDLVALRERAAQVLQHAPTQLFGLASALRFLARFASMSGE